MYKDTVLHYQLLIFMLLYINIQRSIATHTKKKTHNYSGE